MWTAANLIIEGRLQSVHHCLRPVAVECTYWCLATKVCLRPYVSRLHELLQPSQVGVSIPQGFKAAVHATRSFMAQTPSEKVLLKLDTKNAFNSICQGLQAAQTHLPETYPFIWGCYSSKTSLFRGEFCLDSGNGVQQRDPLGLTLFSPRHWWSYIQGQIKPKCFVPWWWVYWWRPSDCAQQCCQRQEWTILIWSRKNSKCELLIVNHTTSQERSQTTKLFQDEFPTISTPALNIWQLLGSPLHQKSVPLHLEAKTKVLDNIFENLELIQPHEAFFVLINCLSISKLIFTAKCTMLQVQRGTGGVWHCHKNQDGKICNVSWSRKLVTSILPIIHAGLGFCSAADLSLTCFLPLSHACKGLVNRLLSFVNLELPYGNVNDASDTWSKHHDSSPLQKGIQAVWVDLACKDSLNTLLNTKNPWNHCRLLTAQESHTTPWSEAFPITNIGNLISPDKLRIAITLWIGAKIFESTKCRCGKSVDELGSMASPVLKMQAFPRHSAINSILKRSLTCSNLPSTLELVGLTNDGRRPDGLTLSPGPYA